MTPPDQLFCAMVEHPYGEPSTDGNYVGKVEPGDSFVERLPN